MTTTTAPVRTKSTARSKTIVVGPGAAEIDPQRFARRSRFQTVFLGVATPVVLIALWEVAAQLGWIDTRFFPAPSRVAMSAVTMWNEGQLQSDFMTTFSALITGLLGGFVAGCIAGFLMGLVPTLRAAFEPILAALYTVPKLAILPLLLLIFGIGVLPKIILVGLGVFFIVWIAVLEAMVSVPGGYLETVRSFKVGRFRGFRQVIFPSVLPSIFVGLRIAVGTAVLIIVGVEFVSGGAGLGYRIWNSWTIFAADRMYVGIVVVAVLGYLLKLAVDMVANLSMPWAPRRISRR